MYEAILDALRRGAGSEALASAREAVAVAPGDATAHRLLAAALRHTGDHAAALASIDHAIELAPEEASLHMERAGLLLQARDLDAAQIALARASGLDPNQFSAYILQGQLALGRGDLDEVERLARLAARIAPDHPQVAALEGMLALFRGDGSRALSLMTQASERDPDDVQLRYALGFAYLREGHLAFAERAFLGIAETVPEGRGLRALVAELMRRQGRAAEAVDVLQPLLDGADPGPALRRFAGELHLAAGDHQAALPLLRAALAAHPGDRRTLLATLEAWRRADDREGARNALDAALATTHQASDLWRARLLVEEPGTPGAGAVAERWLAAMPDDPVALEARMAMLDASGRGEEADTLVERILQLQPDHRRAQTRVLERLLASDPDAAAARAGGLLAQANDVDARAFFGGWLGIALDRAGKTDAAVQAWLDVIRETSAVRPALPQKTSVAGLTHNLDDPPGGVAPAPAGTLWGPPGSGVERVAAALAATGIAVDANQVLAAASGDPSPDQPPASIAGPENPSAASPDLGAAIRWLPWWDSAAISGQRSTVDGVLLVVVRDPRDMLLDWLAFSAPGGYGLPTLSAAAEHLADAVRVIVQSAEQDRPHRLLRIDHSIGNTAVLAGDAAAALGLESTLSPDAPVGFSRLPAGRWRTYAETLAEPFAVLQHSAVALGYSAD